jgi:hypothetical protein
MNQSSNQGCGAFYPFCRQGRRRSMGASWRHGVAWALGGLMLSMVGGMTAELSEADPDADAFKGTGRCRFWVENYELTAKTESAINKVVDDAVRQHEKVFGFTARPDFQVRIRIFGRFTEFERYTRTNQFARQLIQSSQNISNLGGYYSHRLRQIVTWRQRHPTDLGNTLLHEASHAILHAAYRRIPIWLSEGSATYFAYPRHVQDDRDIGSLQYRWAKLNVMLRGGQLPPVRTMLNWKDEEWMRIDPAVSYTTAWSLFQLLMSTPERQDLMREYLRTLQSRRQRDKEPAAIFEQLSPGGTAQLEKDWQEWIRKGGARVLGKEMEEILKQVR